MKRDEPRAVYYLRVIAPQDDDSVRPRGADDLLTQAQEKAGLSADEWRMLPVATEAWPAFNQIAEPPLLGHQCRSLIKISEMGEPPERWGHLIRNASKHAAGLENNPHMWKEWLRALRVLATAAEVTGDAPRNNTVTAERVTAALDKGERFNEAHTWDEYTELVRKP